MWKCPDCGGTDLEVNIIARAKLIQDNYGENFQTDLDESSDGSHEWGAESMMFCMNDDCGRQGIVDEFDVESVKYPLIGKRFATLKEDSEEDEDYGEVTHPVGSEFTVHAWNHYDRAEKANYFDVVWHRAVNAEGTEVDPSGMWTVWSENEIKTEAKEVTHV